MKIVVKEESTLLKYLEENLDMSKRNIKKYLKNGSIYVDGTRTTQFDYPLMVDSIVVIDTNKKKLNKIPFAVLYEDENIIVVDKPAGLEYCIGKGKGTNNISYSKRISKS